MIHLLPRTARHYDPPREPNQVDVYIDVDDETVKQSLTDIESFEGLTSLSNRILWHLVRNYFADIRQEIPYQWFTNPRSQGCPRFQSGEELANSVGKINAYYSL